MSEKFTTNEIPDQTGKTILVTGGSSGIGYQIAKVLAQKGANVIIALRDPKIAKQVLSSLKEQAPSADISTVILDLANLASVKSVARRLTISKLDVLINNAGVMNIPKRTFTSDGFEMHMGTNHLGHFALTLELLPLLRKADSPRVICQSSLSAYGVHIDFNNLQSELKYSPMGAYNQSKLCNVLFANELGRLEPELTSVAVQPGFGLTRLQRYTPNVLSFFLKFIGQPVENCALPALYAATQADVKTGMFFGPTGIFSRGSAAPRKGPDQADDVQLAGQLWEVSEKLTGVKLSDLK
jgi:NAD(P)-dependent dehydrogenase (short-subunit alcohol dehydrogenase family)